MLEGKVAIVTGAAKGLGLGIAETLGKNGAKVVIVDLDEEALGTALTGLKQEGIEAVSAVADVSRVPAIDEVCKAAVETFGKIDILMNNAGGSAHTPLKIEDVTEEHFDRVTDWNLRSTFFCTKIVLPELKKSKGCIINMSSIAGRAGFDLVSPQYSASKAGIIGMTRNLAKHLGPDGVRVNAIAPGFMRSGPRAEGIWQTRNNDEVLRQVALRDRGYIEDIANAALFLASDQSKYITGAVLDVNGGFLAV